MPLRELKRLQAVGRFLDLKFESEKEVQEIVELAARVCHTKYATITIIEDELQDLWYSYGFDGSLSTSCTSLFCQKQNERESIVIEDTLRDPELRDSKLVREEPHIRFYASTPLITHDGQLLGALGIYHDQPLALSKPQKAIFEALARQLVQLFEFENSIALIKTQLRESRLQEIRLKSFFDSRLVMHLLMDKAYRILNFNRVLAELIYANHGIQVSNGDDIRRFLQNHNGDVFLYRYDLARQGTPSSLQMESFSKGQVSQWFAHFEPAYGSDGKLIGVSCNAIDITREVHQSAQLQLNNDSFQRISDVQSHRLRGPLSSILGLTQIWKQTGTMPSASEIDMMIAAATQLDNEITQIVAIANDPGNSESTE